MLIPLTLLFYSCTAVSSKPTPPPTCREVFKTPTGGIIVSPNYGEAVPTRGSCVYKIQSRTNTFVLELLDYADAEAFFKVSIDLRFPVKMYASEVTGVPIRFNGSLLKLAYSGEKMSTLGFRMMYSTSPLCSGDQYQCEDGQGCYTQVSVCDKKADCADRSDERFCSRRHCSNNFLRDDYFRCNNGMCIDDYLVNDGYQHCEDGSDEKAEVAYVMLAIASLFLVFAVLVGRRLVHRRDIRRVMENPPEFPLPPFQGPGEQSSSEIHISDLQSGGEIFEGFVYGRRWSEEQQRQKITYVKPKEKRFSFDYTQGDESVAAIASLGVDINACVGLSKENLAKLQSANEIRSRSRSTPSTQKEKNQVVVNFDKNGTPGPT